MTAQAQGTGFATLRLLATTDLHAQIYPYDYYTDTPTDRVGLARLASLITEARSRVANCLLFDNGDALCGNPLGDVVAEGWKPGQSRLHPMISVMNWLGYDAATLGNHEFDHGLSLLSEFLRGATFPIVCANIRPMPHSRKGARLFTRLSKDIILERTIQLEDGQKAPIRIGVTGVLPPQIRHWSRAHVEGELTTRDMVFSAAKSVTSLKARGADLVVVLAHTGLGPDSSRDEMEHAGHAIAALPGVDALIAGHAHGLFPDPNNPTDPSQGHIAGTPAVMPGFWASHLGIIDLQLAQGPTGWRVEHAHSQLRPIVRQTSPMHCQPLTFSQPEVLALAEAEHRATLDYVRRPVASSSVPLNTYFAMLTETPVTHLVAQAQISHVRQALRQTVWRDIPVLASASPFKCGGRGGPTFFTDIPPGDLAMRHLADLYPYPNTIRAVQISGAQLADWLEFAASFFNQIRPGQMDQPLLNPEFAPYNFDTLSGVDYQIDLTQPPRYSPAGHPLNLQSQRIRNLCFQQRPVLPDEKFIVATNSYRAAGGGGLAFLRDDAQTVFSNRDSVRDILVRHILMRGQITTTFPTAWTFCKVGQNTSACFETSPRALDHLTEIAPLAPQFLHLTPQGFARFRLML